VERGNVKIHPLSLQRISAHTNRQEAEDDSGLAKRVNLVRSGESSQLTEPDACPPLELLIFAYRMHSLYTVRTVPFANAFA
jgi:hypothetical protein